MANIDKAFIENLQNFTIALENIVELMDNESKKGGDATNKALSSMDSKNLGTVVEAMTLLLDSNKRIETNTEKILEEIKASKKQKEKGMFDKIEGKENKNKITDGIQTVILIAAGVLAIGLAFKLIGKVDFLSVIALSMGMLMVSLAFSEIAKIENLTPKKTLIVGLALIVIAGAITISSFILKAFQPLSAAQMLSFIIVSAALGIGAFFIFKAVKDLEIKPKDIAKYLLLPIILPAIAAGLVASSWFLKGIAPIGLMQAISIVFVGLAMADRKSVV